MTDGDHGQMHGARFSDWLLANPLSSQGPLARFFLSGNIFRHLPSQKCVTHITSFQCEATTSILQAYIFPITLSWCSWRKRLSCSALTLIFDWPEWPSSIAFYDLGWNPLRCSLNLWWPPTPERQINTLPVRPGAWEGHDGVTNWPITLWETSQNDVFLHITHTHAYKLALALSLSLYPVSPPLAVRCVCRSTVAKWLPLSQVVSLVRLVPPFTLSYGL